MQVRFMVLEAADTEIVNGEEVIKSTTEYLSISEVKELEFHNEPFSTKDNSVFIVLYVDNGLTYYLPVRVETMAHFLDLSNGISFDWSGYYATRHKVFDGVDILEAKEALARNKATWDIHKKEIKNGYME